MDRLQTVYLDSSVLLRRVLNQPGALHSLIWDRGISSELLLVEMERTLRRLRLLGKIDTVGLANARNQAEEYARTLELIPISSAVLTRAAGHFPASIATLDAIHLSSALLWSERNRESLSLLTHDGQLANAAILSGIQVYPWPLS